MSDLEPCFAGGVWYKRAGAKRVSLVGFPPSEGALIATGRGGVRNHSNKG
jgi:hypothetical protein